MDRLTRQRHAELERLGATRTELEAARATLAEQVRLILPQRYLR